MLYFRCLFDDIYDTFLRCGYFDTGDSLEGVLDIFMSD